MTERGLKTSTFTNVFFYFCHVFLRFLTFFIFFLERFYIYGLRWFRWCRLSETLYNNGCCWNRAKRSSEDCIKDMKRLGLSKKDAQSRNKWRQKENQRKPANSGVPLNHHRKKYSATQQVFWHPLSVSPSFFVVSCPFECNITVVGSVA